MLKVGYPKVKARYADDHVVNVYKKSSSLRDAARRLDLSHSRVHQIVTLTAPHLLRSRGREEGSRWEVMRVKEKRKIKIRMKRKKHNG